MTRPTYGPLRYELEAVADSAGVALVNLGVGLPEEGYATAVYAVTVEVPAAASSPAVTLLLAGEPIATGHAAGSSFR